MDAMCIVLFSVVRRTKGSVCGVYLDADDIRDLLSDFGAILAVWRG